MNAAVSVRDRYGDERLTASVERIAARLPASLRDDLEEIVLLKRVVVPGEESRLEIGRKVRVVVNVGPLAARVGAVSAGLGAAVLEQVFLQVARYALLRSGDGLRPADSPEVEKMAAELLMRVRGAA